MLRPLFKSFCEHANLWKQVQTKYSTNRRWNYRTLPKPDEGVVGEETFGLESVTREQHSIFPDPTSNSRLYNGIPYNQLHICSIKVSKNNTHVVITNANGVPKINRSCGIEGFKNAKKGTNVAAQATAISISTRALEKGIKDIRVKVDGLGPGRMAAVKGLQMGGMNIISITDNTKVSWNPVRPRKARRL